MAEERQERPSRFRRFVVTTAALMLLLVGVGTLVAGCTLTDSTPDVSRLTWESSTILFDRDGKEMYRLHGGENRTPIKLDQVPNYVQQAFIDIEDPNFRTHHGIDLKGLVRAAFRTSLYLLHLPGGHLEGGSTITQQLARDAWLTQDVNMKRKLEEAWVALQVERHYTKDEILEMYLNQIYFGHGAYGIEAAARTFFGKEVKDLTVAEGAQLAGMINGPSIYDPYQNPDDSLARRNLVLAAMLKDNDINQAQYDTAKAEVPKLGSKQAPTQNAGNAFIDYVINVLQDAKPGLADKYGLKLQNPDTIAKSGLKVYTTIDPKLQALAEQAVSDQMNKADKQYGLTGQKVKPEAAMLVMNPKTGEVLAMVGGREHEAMLEFNRTTDALRQPGSVIKPLVDYIPALEAGLSPATILDDAPVMLSNDGKTVWPQNYDFRYEGLKPMRYGVEQSINPMAVRALQAAGGPAKGLDSGRRLGLTTLTQDDNNLALALGGISKGVSLLDITTAYSAIDNLGTKVDPVVISKIVDANGQTIYEAPVKKAQVVRPAVAYLMLDMMKDVIRKGTAYGFTTGFHGWPAAGKTGTTEDNRDAWFMGMTPDLVATVWNGYDTPDTHLKWTGAFVPVQIWSQFMNAVQTKPTADWPRPDGVSTVQVCRQTGMLPNALCPKDQITTDLFLAGTEPKSPGNLLVQAKAVQVAVPTPDHKGTTTQWELWQAGCAGLPVDKVFIKRPQPRVLHPTDPLNPKYVPADAKDELPTQVCQPVPWWQQLFPGLSGQGMTLPGSGTQVPPTTPGVPVPQPPGTGTVPVQPGGPGFSVPGNPGTGY